MAFNKYMLARHGKDRDALGFDYLFFLGENDKRGAVLHDIHDPNFVGLVMPLRVPEETESRRMKPIPDWIRTIPAKT